MRKRGRLSPREFQRAKNAAFNLYGMLQFSQEVKPLRKRGTPGGDGRPLEASVNDDIHGAVKAAPNVKLYRNNRGVAVYGNKQVAYGVGPRGGSDWIGYRRVLITSDMIGSFIAQFVAIEAKRPGEKADDNQQRFIDQVNAAGGCAGMATSGEQALELLT
jgi:hypothetical protein